MSHIIERLEQRTFLNAGQLDATFGTGGHTQIHTGTALAARDLDLSTQDQIVVTAAEDNDLRIWKLTRDGQVQPTFGPNGDGTLTVPVAALTNPGPISTIAAPDGSIFVLAGNLLYKYKSNGLRDKSFGTNGRAIVHAMAATDVSDATVDIYGRPYIVGKDATGNLAIIRLATNGKPDLTFGTQSVLEPGGAIKPGSSSTTFHARTLADGSMMFAGQSVGTASHSGSEASDPAFDLDEIKLTLNGALAKSFATKGVRVIQWIDTDLDQYTVQNAMLTSNGSFAVIVADHQDLNHTDVGTDVYTQEGAAQNAAPIAAPVVGSSNIFDVGTLITAGINDGALSSTLSILFNDSSGTQTFADTAANTAAAAALSGWFPGHLEEQSDGSIISLSGPSDSNTASKGFRIDRLFRDDSPAAQLNAKTISKPQTTSYKFSVQYRDDDGVSLATLGNDDLTVTFADGTTHRATLVTTDATDDGKTITATYRVAAPPGGWTAARNGKYTVKVNKRSVRDINGNPTSPRTIGSFNVAIGA